MDSIGIIDYSRLKYIPKRHRNTHEFCFLLHDKMVNILIEYEESGAHLQVENTLKDILINEDKEIDILEYLKNNNLTKEYKRHIISHVIIALTQDMLHFIYEALLCFEKRKFSVAFSLLRKPLKEHLIYFSWILGNEDDFISRFEKDTHKSFKINSKEEKIKIFDNAIKQLTNYETFDGELIWDIIFNKKEPSSFEPTLQKATHLTTSMGELLKTEEYTFNFIFEDPSDDYYFEFAYSKLPYLLFFMIQVLFECYNKISAINNITYSYNLITTMGCYEALFLNGKQHMPSMLQKQFKDFLKCNHCGSNLKIYKKDAPNFFINERLPCRTCGLISTIPLYWLFSYGKINIRQDKKVNKILDDE